MERRHGARPQRVLLVDDSSDIREMWRLWLTYWGFSVEKAPNGAEAVRKAQLDPPDLVLMDLAMPVMDGVEATRELKGNPATAGVPVLALSSQHHDSAAQDAKIAGCETFIPKAVTPDELLEQIRSSFARLRRT